MTFERRLVWNRDTGKWHAFRHVRFYNRVPFFGGIFYEAIEQRFWEAKCSFVLNLHPYIVAFERAARLALDCKLQASCERPRPSYEM